MALEGFSDAKRPGGSGGAVGSQKLSLCAIRAITSCLSCSSDPIKGFVSAAADLGEGQWGGSVREKFLKALSGSGMGPFVLSVLLVPELKSSTCVGSGEPLRAEYSHFPALLEGSGEGEWAREGVGEWEDTWNSGEP